jgi:hypothetical protein
MLNGYSDKATDELYDKMYEWIQTHTIYDFLGIVTAVIAAKEDWYAGVYKKEEVKQ